MKLKHFTLVLILLAALVFVTPASANQALCTGSGGTWEGPDANNGDCVYEAGSSIAVSSCVSSHASYVISYVGGVETTTQCYYGNFTAVKSDGPKNESFTLRLGRGKNGWVNFPAGTCNVNCSINTQMPQEAKNQLFEDGLATLYVRVDGGFGTGGYQVCFENPYGASRTIYQFTGGSWWPIARGSGTTICGTANGDSSFYLGGKP
jgi:hypothetical protein